MFCVGGVSHQDGCSPVLLKAILTGKLRATQNYYSLPESFLSYTFRKNDDEARCM